MTSPSSVIDLYAHETLSSEQPQWYELKQKLNEIQTDFRRAADLITSAQQAQNEMDDALYLCHVLLNRELAAMKPDDARRVWYRSVQNRVKKARDHPYNRFTQNIQ